MKKPEDLYVDDFKIISDNCIALGKDWFLTKADMGDGIVKLFVHKNGHEIAGLVNAIKCSDSSIESIWELIQEPYCMQRIADVVNN